MRQRSVRGEGTHERVPHAREDGSTSRSSVATVQQEAAGPRRAVRASPDGRPTGTGRRRPKRGKRRILRWFAGTTAVLILVTAGAGYLYYRHLNSNIRSGERSGGNSGVKKAEPNATGETPLNILLIGSDSRNKPENVELGGSRDSVGSKPLADVQMLLHVSADRESASVVSIPRDTRVDIPACTDPETGEHFGATNTIINESLTRGGPGCTLTTWEKLTGVYINYWMMIDFSGVVSMADAIGGVEVCVKQNVHDRPLPRVPGGSGLRLEAGPNKIKGEQALQWLRTRHAFVSDIGRAKAQHMYMNSMMRELKDQNVFTDTSRLMDLAEAATKSLEVSEEIAKIEKLFDLGMQLKNVPTNRITMTTMPWDTDPQNKNHVVPTQDADKVWAMLRADVPFDTNGKKTDGKKKPAAKKSATPAAPGTLSVTVINGTAGTDNLPVSNRASSIADTLKSKGFVKAVASQTVEPRNETVLNYPKSGGSQGKADALSVAEAMGLPASGVRPSGEVEQISLAVGADWREGATYPEQKQPEAGSLPDTADALNGSNEDACMDVYKPYRW